MRRVRKKGSNKEKVFGCDLLEHLTASAQEIPLVLRSCSEFVEQNGIVDGIYRLSGVSSNIQKLRGEFESDGSPDLNKEVYLQDIHCISSLCKAYFRELPNPLLTYQLYDKFAEAVAIQLEEERLVKIKDVLKELPPLHYRTLEFLMLHLVKMASYSSETNMHARNLAIVWAPNLLRSKDIEACGFNGTAAFMEVRVQSIVVEFILTHVPQLFPQEGVSSERRKSLPSPSVMPNQDEGFFRSTQPNFGNISPGDGPLAIRPYHAIIEGTDKRKGSLKGRKWMSIFNIGVRIQDQRRRHKHSTKEKERPALRPARSMDSLSTPLYPNEGSRRSAQRPPSTHMSPLVTSSTQPSSDTPVSTGGMGGSEYAVTYRRGTGLVSGSAGIQGTYTVLNPEGLGTAGNESIQSRSPGVSSKAGRRAAMHITGPTLVTVPLHITSNLAYGVLQGGGSDRLIHRGRDKDEGDKVEGKEGGERTDRKERRGMEWKVEESRKVEEEEVSHKEKEVPDIEGNKAEAGGVSGEKAEGVEDEEDKEVKRDLSQKLEPVMEDRNVCGEQRTKSLNSNTEDDKDEAAADHDQDVDDNSEYMEMKGRMQANDQSAAVTQHGEDGVFDASDILNLTEVEGDDQEMFGYVQDNFDFLDHMDCSMSYQVNEFSVEPPGHSDDEYENMEQAQASHHPAGPQTCPQPSLDTQKQSQTELKPHRPLSIDLHNRHTKSLSLPYMTSPVHGPEESCSEDEEVLRDDSDDSYDSEDDQSMFVQSLPLDFSLNNLSGLERGTETKLRSNPDRGRPLSESQTSERMNCPSPKLELSAWKETTTGDEEQVEVESGTDEDGLDERQITKKNADDKVLHEGAQLENDMQSKVTDEHSSILKDSQTGTSDASTTCCTEFLPPSNEEINESTPEMEIKNEDVKEMVEIPPGDSPPQGASCATLRETADVQLEESSDTSVMPAHHPGACDSRDAAETEDTCQQSVLLKKDCNENMGEECVEGGSEGEAGKNPEGSKERQSSICTNSDIWNELEDVVCEVIEDEESEQPEMEAAAAQADVVKDGDEGEQTAAASGEKMVEADGGETNKSEVRVEDEEESVEGTLGTDPMMQEESEEDEMDLPTRSELEKVTQEKRAFNEEAQHHDRGEVVSKETEKEKNDSERDGEQSTEGPSVDKKQPEIRSDIKELKESKKCESSDSSLGGVGRKLIVSKHPKVYQVKAVPVVPPKPQHCKMTALTLRQQQQQRDADKGRDNAPRAPAEQDRVSAEEQTRDGDDESAERKERLTLPRDKERRRDGAEGAARDATRNSPLSMCFDEAVAIATLRREKERVREGEADAEGLGK
ncbi:uncharacterized protein PAE49_016015 [Odontesthes bonariensis]